MQAPAPRHDNLESVDLVLAMLELLAGAAQPRALGEIALALGISKPRAHRHLRALIANDYVRQDAATDRYEITARLLGLGEAVRERLSFAGAARPAMALLRDATGQAVTASTLVAAQVTIVELLQGRTIVQFAIRPGTVMDPLRSAHGMVAMAFGGIPADDAAAAAIAAVRARGWATAPERIMRGVNALAAPVFGHDGCWAGTLAIVGSIDAIPAMPDDALIAQVADAARDTSERLGWKAPR